MGMADGNVEMAFLLVFCAGMATVLGAALVFNERFVAYANKRFLAGCLSFAAGVMMYVSFVEIFAKSQLAYKEAGYSESNSTLYATLTFFFGHGMYRVLDALVHKLDPVGGGHFDFPDEGTARVVEEEAGKIAKAKVGLREAEGNELAIVGGASAVTEAEDTAAADAGAAVGVDAAAKVGVQRGATLEEEKSPEEVARLKRMGLMTALAIGIHNFPEGLATFVAALDDLKVGATLAVAIAIHNIPEGMCVAIPVYYATGNRRQAFMWALLSGLSEPVGAGLGWVVLHGVMDDAVMGFLFGSVAGMMVTICTMELMPTAFRFDPKDEVSSNCFMMGMATMAASLVLFLFAV
jgi:ZIP family zinc transporter